MVHAREGDGVKVIVLTSDKYLHALQPFAWLFNKYWSSAQPVTVAGFTPPDFGLPGNFTFHSIGAFEDYPVARWSDALIKLLNEIEDETLALFLEDYWLIRPVNIEAVNMLDDYALQFKNVLRIDLTTDRLFSFGPRYPQDVPDYGNCGYLDLVKTNPGTAYQMSMMAAIWRRDNLLSTLIPGETPWQLEIDGTARLAMRDDLLVLGCRQWPVRHTLAYRSGNSSEVNLSELRLADAAHIKGSGWVDSEKSGKAYVFPDNYDPEYISI